MIDTREAAPELLRATAPFPPNESFSDEGELARETK